MGFFLRLRFPICKLFIRIKSLLLPHPRSGTPVGIGSVAATFRRLFAASLTILKLNGLKRPPPLLSPTVACVDRSAGSVCWGHSLPRGDEMSCPVQEGSLPWPAVGAAVGCELSRRRRPTCLRFPPRGLTFRPSLPAAQPPGSERRCPTRANPESPSLKVPVLLVRANHKFSPGSRGSGREFSATFNPPQQALTFIFDIGKLRHGEVK